MATTSPAKGFNLNLMHAVVARSTRRRGAPTTTYNSALFVRPQSPAVFVSRTAAHVILSPVNKTGAHIDIASLGVILRCIGWALALLLWRVILGRVRTIRRFRWATGNVQKGTPCGAPGHAFMVRSFVPALVHEMPWWESLLRYLVRCENRH